MKVPKWRCNRPCADWLRARDLRLSAVPGSSAPPARSARSARSQRTPVPLAVTGPEDVQHAPREERVNVRRTMLLLLALPLLQVGLICGATAGASDRTKLSDSSGQEGGGLQSVLESVLSPAFGATIIIIITVVVSTSAYLCFLHYICAGCCKPTQVAPMAQPDGNKVEEQV